MSSVFKLHDAQFALQLHNQINRLDVTGLTENAILPNDVSVFVYIFFFGFVMGHIN